MRHANGLSMTQHYWDTQATLIDIFEKLWTCLTLQNVIMWVKTKLKSPTSFITQGRVSSVPLHIFVVTMHIGICDAHWDIQWRDNRHHECAFTAEMLKAAGRKQLSWLDKTRWICFQQWWGCEESFILNRYEGKGEALGRSNYHDLKLAGQVIKLLEWALDFYIWNMMNMDEVQFAFMPSRGTTDTICVHQRHEKYLAINEPLYFAFLPFCLQSCAKEGPVVDLAKPQCQGMGRVCHSGHILQGRSYALVIGQYSEEFGVDVGVHQGSALSPLHLTLVFDALSSEFCCGVPCEPFNADDAALTPGGVYLSAQGMEGWPTMSPDRKCQDYVYAKWECLSTMYKIKHNLRHENKVNENKVLSYCEALIYK